MWREQGRIITGDACEILKELPDGSAHCCVTSPPYWGLRDYGIAGQIGLEASPVEYIASLLNVFEQVWRVLRDDGTLWLNLGDSYIGYHGNKNAKGGKAPSDLPGYRENMRASTVGLNGLKAKDLAGIPWRVAFALQEKGWYLRSDVIWHKTNSKPESVKDRPTKAHEYIFLLSKNKKYFYDYHAVRVASSRKDKRRINKKQQRAMQGLPDRQPNSGGSASYGPKVGTYGSPGDGFCNLRDVWPVSIRDYQKHIAFFPPDLIRPCIRAGCPVGGLCVDPFFGSGTVGLVCLEEKRSFIGIELNPEYVAMAEKRLDKMG